MTRPLSLLIAAVATLVAAAPASAKPAGACPEREFSKVFSAFGDNALYTLAPDGDIEGGASGWELGDGASVVPESLVDSAGRGVGDAVFGAR
jgi:hypothetical protein